MSKMIPPGTILVAEPPKFSDRELEILLQPVLTKELIEELKNIYSVKNISKEKNVKKLKVGTSIGSLVSNGYFTRGKTYKVHDSDLDIRRVWALDDNNFVEMLDKGEWELIDSVEKKERVKNDKDGWGDWG